MATPITIIKSANVDEAVVGQEIIYTLRVTNTTGVILNSVVVSDLLAPSLAFVPGSVEVNTFPMPLANIASGVEIGPMGLAVSKNLVFRAVIVANPEDMLTNESTVVYHYTDPATGKEMMETAISNTAMVQVEVAEIVCTKTTTATQVSLGDIIFYEVSLKNKGTIPTFNVIYKDILPPSIELIPTSVTVNDVAVIDPDLEAGINVGSIAPADEVLLRYAATVVGGSCSGLIVNSGSAEFYYVLPNRVTGHKVSNSSSVSVPVNIVTFKQVVLNKRVCIPSVKPDVEDVEDVTAEIKIDNAYVLNTIKGVSNEAQKLSSYKLIVHGTILVSAMYTALVSDQALHSVHSEIPFSSFLILPPDYNEQVVEVNPVLEDVSVSSVTQRAFEISLAFLLVGQIK